MFFGIVDHLYLSGREKSRCKAWKEVLEGEQVESLACLQCTVASECESGLRRGGGEEACMWGQAMQGAGAQDKDLGFHFSIVKKPRRGFKQRSEMIIYVCGEEIGEWFYGAQLGGYCAF